MGVSNTEPFVARFLPDEEPEYVGLVYAVVLLWGLGDVLSTYFTFAVLGYSAAESNPWMDILLSYNPVLVAVVKGAVVLYVGVVLLAYREVVQRVPVWRFWLSMLVIGGILVVVNNLAVGLVALS